MVPGINPLSYQLSPVLLPAAAPPLLHELVARQARDAEQEGRLPHLGRVLARAVRPLRVGGGELLGRCEASGKVRWYIDRDREIEPPISAISNHVRTAMKEGEGTIKANCSLHPSLQTA